MPLTNQEEKLSATRDAAFQELVSRLLPDSIPGKAFKKYDALLVCDNDGPLGISTHVLAYASPVFDAMFF